MNNNLIVVSFLVINVLEIFEMNFTRNLYPPDLIFACKDNWSYSETKFWTKKVKFRAFWEYYLCTCPVYKYLFKVNSKITRTTFLDVFWVFLVLTLLVSLLVFCHSDSDLIWLKSWKESIIYLTSAYKIKYFEPTVSCDITWKNLTRSVCYGSLPCLIKAVKAVSLFF